MNVEFDLQKEKASAIIRMLSIVWPTIRLHEKDDLLCIEALGCPALDCKSDSLYELSQTLLRNAHDVVNETLKRNGAVVLRVIPYYGMTEFSDLFKTYEVEGKTAFDMYTHTLREVAVGVEQQIEALHVKALSEK